MIVLLKQAVLLSTLRAYSLRSLLDKSGKKKVFLTCLGKMEATLHAGYFLASKINRCVSRTLGIQRCKFRLCSDS